MLDAKRPYVICHMLPSIDGRIVIRDWDLDGATRAPSLFDVANRRAPARKLKLISMEKRSGGIVWLRYKVG